MARESFSTSPAARRRRLGVAIAAAALTAPAAIAAPTTASAQEDETHTLVAGTTVLGSIPHMNPLDSGWLLQGEFNNLMYDPMIRYSQEDWSSAPGIAVSWTPSEDGLTWTYELDPEATWSDGEPITADDVKFTYELLQTNEVFNGRHGELVNNFTSIEAVDDKTVEITIAEPSSAMTLLTGTAIMIMPEHVWGEMENPAEYFGEPGQPTSGPFTLAEFSPGERVVLEANPDYWAGPVAYDELVFQNYESTEAMVQALIAGEVDVMSGLNPQQYEALQGEDHITTYEGQGRHWTAIGFNAGAQTQDGEEFGDGHPALKDPAVRQAVHHVIDKERLVEVILDGHGTPGVGLIPPIFSQYAYDPGDDLVEVSAEVGNQILDDAGYTERNDDGVRIDPESGEPLVFRLTYHSDRPEYAIIKDFLVDWVAELDIVLEDIAMETTPLNEEFNAGNFDITFGGWSVDPDPTADLAYHTCDRLPETVEPTDLTFAFWCNDEYDALFEQQLVETDPAARAELVQEMGAILYDQVPQIELYYESTLAAWNSDRWTGFENGAQPSDGGMILGQKGAFGYESAAPVGATETTG